MNEDLIFAACIGFLAGVWWTMKEQERREHWIETGRRLERGKCPPTPDLKSV